MIADTGIQGVVVDGAGRGVAGARVLADTDFRILPLDLLDGIDSQMKSKVTGADGSFRFDNPREAGDGRSTTMCILAVCGTLVSRPREACVTGGSSCIVPPLLLETGRRGTLRVRVPAGTPKAAAFVWLRCFHKQEQAGRQKSDTEEAPGIALSHMATTDEEGGTMAGPLPRGASCSMEVRVQHPQCVSLRVRVMGGIDELLEAPIRLRRGLVVRGRVVGPEGVAVANLPISITHIGDSPATFDDFEPRCTTETDGSFVVSGVPPSGGALHIGPLPDQGPERTFSALVWVARSKPGRHVDLGEVRLSVHALTPLRGVVVGPDGTGVAGAHIHAHATDHIADCGPGVDSGEGGQFELLVPAEGTCVICASGGNGLLGLVAGVTAEDQGIAIRLVSPSADGPEHRRG